MSSLLVPIMSGRLAGELWIHADSTLSIRGLQRPLTRQRLIDVLGLVRRLESWTAVVVSCRELSCLSCTIGAVSNALKFLS